MEIKRNGSQPSAKGPVEYFTGSVRIDSPFQGADAARVSGAVVTFEPGARTAWQQSGSIICRSRITALTDFQRETNFF
jgi:quercetin dioxygenase-like cupin family protein